MPEIGQHLKTKIFLETVEQKVCNKNGRAIDLFYFKISITLAWGVGRVVCGVCDSVWRVMRSDSPRNRQKVTIILSQVPREHRGLLAKQSSNRTGRKLPDICTCELLLM